MNKLTIEFSDATMALLLNLSEKREESKRKKACLVKTRLLYPGEERERCPFSFLEEHANPSGDAVAEPRPNSPPYLPGESRPVVPNVHYSQEDNKDSEATTSGSTLNYCMEVLEKIASDPLVLNDTLDVLTGRQNYDEVVVKTIARYLGLPENLVLPVYQSLVGANRPEFLNLEQLTRLGRRREQTNEEVDIEPTEGDEEKQETVESKSEETPESKSEEKQEETSESKSEEKREETNVTEKPDLTLKELSYLLETLLDENQPKLIRGGLLHKDGTFNCIPGVTLVDSFPEGWNEQDAMSRLLTMTMMNTSDSLVSSLLGSVLGGGFSTGIFAGFNPKSKEVTDQEMTQLANEVISSSLSNLGLTTPSNVTITSDDESQ